MREWLGDPKKTAAKRRELLTTLAYQPEPVPFNHRDCCAKRFCRTRGGVISDSDQSRRGNRRDARPSDRRFAATSPFQCWSALHEHGGMLPLGREKLFPRSTACADVSRLSATMLRRHLPGDFFPANGFAVFAIDQFGFGDRGYWHAKDDVGVIDRTDVSPKKDLALRLRMRYEQFWHSPRAPDVRRHGGARSRCTTTVDRSTFLETIPEIDTRAGVGAFGLSVGCMWAHHLAAFDPRVTASVRVCWTGDFETMINADGPRVLGTHFLFPGINAEMHVPEMVALSDPSAVLIINGRKDPLYPLRHRNGRGGRSRTLRWRRGGRRGFAGRISTAGTSFCRRSNTKRFDFFRTFCREPSAIHPIPETEKCHDDPAHRNRDPGRIASASGFVQRRPRPNPRAMSHPHSKVP
jgi:hypothetical protein